MCKPIKKLILTILLIFPLTLSAESIFNSEENSEKFSTFETILLAEGSFLANAWLASEDPHAYGVVLALLAPLAAAGEGNSSETTKWVGLIAAESIAIYNIGIDTNKKSKSDIFKKNFIAWHLFAATIGVTGYIMGDFDSEQSLSLKPNFNGGANLVYSKRF